ncbi:MAG: tyrosine--tRNA ligase, partial [Oscillospiraceae bacterium]|nr:tyrosine--tRNA ligase [Oscillospiraceae bacterium]
NYMLMQSYDFLMLAREYDCKMELGGDDQWSNILGGIDLNRRKDQRQVYGMTFTLLTNSEGKKMGKTAKGAVWLDPNKTSPYEFYQYWRNVDDADVCKCMKLLTFVPMEEISEYEKLEGSALNAVKARLAYEVTALVHGKEEADKADAAAKAVFSGAGDDANMPTAEITAAELGEGMPVLDLLAKVGFIPSKGEGRRLIQQNGLSINDEKVADINLMITAASFTDGKLVAKKGKKSFLKIVIK